MSSMNRKYLIPTIILIGTIYCHFVDLDWFPFSNYPMYSKLFLPGNDMQVYDFSVVEENGEEHDIETRKYLSPFWSASLKEAIFFDKDQSKINKKVDAIFEFYNKRLQKDNKPKIVALRLYSKHYNWKKLVEKKIKSSNLIVPDPEKNELIYESK